MEQKIKVLSKPIGAAEYKAVMKEITYQECFQQHNYRIKIPMGWVYVIRDLTRDLMVLVKGNPDLENFRIHRMAQLGTGELFVDVSYPHNRSVTGLLRKAQVRCSHTCQICGVPGRHYLFGDTNRSWCADCAAPALLLADIERLDERLLEDFSSATFAVRRMPAGLRLGFRKWVALQEERMPDLADMVGTWHARDWRTALRAMESALKEFSKRGNE
jgi:hypothetical protein